MQLRALTAISFDGDQITVVPEDDDKLWETHLQIVNQAQANRAALFQALLSSATGLIGESAQ